MTTEPIEVTVLGLGAMGRALAGSLLDAGHRETVWNRTASRGDDLAARGAVRAATPTAAIAASGLVIVCLLDHDAVREVLQPAAGAVRGRTLADLTNGTPAQARELAAWVEGHGAEFLDGGIMAVPSMLGRAGFVLYSGSRAAFERYGPALAALGEPRFTGDDPGAAALFDLALLAAMYGMYGGFLHAVALIRASGWPASDFAPMAASWLTAMTAGLPSMAAAVDSGTDGTPGSGIAMQATGFGNLLDAGDDAGIRSDLLAPMGALLQRAVEAGLGDHGIAALAGLLQTDGTKEAV